MSIFECYLKHVNHVKFNKVKLTGIRDLVTELYLDQKGDIRACGRFSLGLYERKDDSNVPMLTRVSNPKDIQDRTAGLIHINLGLRIGPTSNPFSVSYQFLESNSCEQVIISSK